MAKEKVKIYYRSAQRSGSPCPYCGKYGWETSFCEDNVCGGFQVHYSCLNKMKKWQEKTGVLVNVLAPDQDPYKIFDMRKYFIVNILDKIGDRKKYLEGKVNY